VNRPRVSRRRLHLCVAALFCLEPPVKAQQSASTNNAAAQDIPHKSRRKLAKVSKPADFTGAGLLQFEHGYDGILLASIQKDDHAR
jgi:hypothetical protein